MSPRLRRCLVGSTPLDLDLIDATGDARDAFLVLAAMALVAVALLAAFRRHGAFASPDVRRVASGPPLARMDGWANSTSRADPHGGQNQRKRATRVML